MREKIKRISFWFLTVIVSDQLGAIVRSFRFDFELHGFSKFLTFFTQECLDFSQEPGAREPGEWE